MMLYEEGRLMTPSFSEYLHAHRHGHDIIPRLLYVALRTPPMPERLLKFRLV